VLLNFPTAWRVAAGALAVVVVITVMVILVQNDASGQEGNVDESIATVLNDYGYLGGFALIYIEESGPPLFIPGDAFLIYVGNRLPRNVPVFLAAWIGFVVAVTFGATNLYLLSRHFGRRLVEHRLARFLDLTPERLDRAESWFKRYGPWTLIFGRHIPGLRVPLTVAAGVLKLRYRVFVLSVVVSSAIWAGAFLILGAVFGPSLERAIRSSPLPYLVAAAALVLVVAGVAVVRARRTSRELEP
jgi:membrane protein DedA with SNARE-associated domain